MAKNQKLSVLVWAMAQSLSFLIGGGCDINTERVELLVDGQVVQRGTGKCTETMERVR